jgi:hypothetical protein
MLAGFVDHLAEFADSTSDYHDKIEVCVTKISKADDITQLEDVLAEVIRRRASSSSTPSARATTCARQSSASTKPKAHQRAAETNSTAPARWFATTS